MAPGSRHLYVVAGEPSGDTHAAHVLQELRLRDPGLGLRGLGGPHMAAAGVELHHDLATDAVMGLFPVLKALPRLAGLFRATVRRLQDDPPAALLLVDYPGFNMRLAARARRLGVPVVYYISPQVWAWARWRIRRLARLVDLMLVILPFEEAVYREQGPPAVYVGHPLMDRLRRSPPDPARVAAARGSGPSPLVGIFPGSRLHVVQSLAPVFLKASAHLRRLPGTEQARFVLALAQEGFRKPALRHAPSDLPLDVQVGRPLEVMEAADLVLTSSGTTTLEVAASLTPFVIGYRVSPVLYALGRLVLSVPHIGLVNLVAGEGLVPEHVGVRSFARPCARDLNRLWTDPVARRHQVEGLRRVRDLLDAEGSYARAASALLEFLDRERPVPAGGS